MSVVTIFVAKETVQQLRALYAFAKDLDSIPRIAMLTYNYLQLQFPGDLMLTFVLCRQQTCTWYIHTYRQTFINTKQKI